MTFEMITVSVMFAVSHFFEEFWLCKPYSSREANSETYLVGKGFKGADPDHPYIQAMFDRMEGKIPLEVPLFDAKHYPKKYLSDIAEASEDIFNKQIEKIELDIERSRRSYKGSYRGRPKHNPIVKGFVAEKEPLLEEWYTKYPIFPIRSECALNMSDALRQR